MDSKEDPRPAPPLPPGEAFGELAAVGYASDPALLVLGLLCLRQLLGRSDRGSTDLLQVSFPCAQVSGEIAFSEDH
jgi:hypothetical protein